MQASSAQNPNRRDFLQAAVSLSVAGGVGLPAARGAAAGGGDRIRVGLVGCGGRGTGAALQAVEADANVVVTCLADLFPDQLAESARLLASRAGERFDCPPTRRHVGADAWRAVVTADVDLVILATPPAWRPSQAVAAVAAGKHVWCEAPAAVDVAGALAVAEAAATAARSGLSFASGLCARHDPATVAALTLVRSGRSPAGRPLHVAVHGDLGLPWIRPVRPGATAEERRLRNWISAPEHSGGHFVERHVHAIDRALWALGDELPTAVHPVSRVRPGADGDHLAVRYQFADGRSIDASIARRPAGMWRCDETVRGDRGTVDLRPTAATATGRWQAAMADLVRAVRAGRPLADGAPLGNATLVAILGRMAVEAGATLRTADVLAPSRPLQSA